MAKSKIKDKEGSAITRAKVKLLIQVPSLIRSLFRWTSVVIIVWLLSKTVIALAGKETIAVFIANVTAGVIGVKAMSIISHGVSYLIAIVGVVYGWLQRRQRRLSIMNKQRHVVELEKQKDPNRTSSEITKFGDPKREDQQ